MTPPPQDSHQTTTPTPHESSPIPEVVLSTVRRSKRLCPSHVQETIPVVTERPTVTNLQEDLNVGPLFTSPKSPHILLENKGKKSTNCYLCSIMTTDKKKRTSIFGCLECKRGFHVNCFAFYHYEKALEKSKRPILQRIIRESDNINIKRRCNWITTCTSSLETARLPFPFN